ncbi:hypothetical protein PTTG_05402, partial [Puccinia triticina 1-1 BBBD Race 1]
MDDPPAVPEQRAKVGRLLNPFATPTIYVQVHNRPSQDLATTHFNGNLNCNSCASSYAGKASCHQERQAPLGHASALGRQHQGVDVVAQRAVANRPGDEAAQQGLRHPSADHRGHPHGGDPRKDRALPQLLSCLFPLVRPGPLLANVSRAAQHLHHRLLQRHALGESPGPPLCPPEEV